MLATINFGLVVTYYKLDTTIVHIPWNYSY